MRQIITILFFFTGVINLLQAQKTSKTFVDVNLDTITQYFDSKNRLLEEYTNGFISKKIVYIPKDTVVLADLTEKIAQATNPEFKYPLIAGDTIYIDVCEQKKKKKIKKQKKNKHQFDCITDQPIECRRKQRRIKEISFIQGDKGNRFSEVRVCNVHWKDVIKESGEYKLRVNNFLALWRRFLRVKFIRIPKDSVQITNYTRDTTIVVDTLPGPQIVLDTTLVPVLSKLVYLPPQRDFENVPVRVEQFEIPIPLDSIGFYAYWIGINKQAQTQYKDLEESIPDDWSQAGVSKPLGAYSLGKPIMLPNIISKKIGLAIRTTNTKTGLEDGFTKKEFAKLNMPYFRRGITLPATKNRTAYLILGNQDPVNGYSIQVEILAAKLTTKKGHIIQSKTIISKPIPQKSKEKTKAKAKAPF